MEGKVIFEGKSKNGTPYIVRYPTISDVQKMCDYVNVISQERTFLTFQGEIIGLEYETAYLTRQLERINKNQTVQLLVFSNDNLIGISSVDMKDRTSSHEGVLGISIANGYREEGIGTKLMELIIDEAKENLPALRIITLGVFGDNPKAYEMYKKFGFIESGRIPKGILHKGEYVDHIHMHKTIKE